MNYRLGAFGWLGGPKFLDDGGASNLGLLDQAFAMAWVRDYIHLFGGSSSREVIFSILGRIYAAD